jgi:putative redox protein
MSVAVATRRQGYAHDVAIDGHALVVDEPEDSGGADQGPSPTRLLAASLASCTAITVEMYAERKGWDVGALRVSVDADRTDAGELHYDVTLHLPGGLTEEQTGRIREIAGKCPVHRALVGDTEISIADRAEVSEPPAGG